MASQTAALLRSIWGIPTWRDNLLTTFTSWVQEGETRNDVKRKVQKLTEMKLAGNEECLQFSVINLNQVNWDQFIEFLCLCYYGKRFHGPLLEVPSEEMWKTLTEAKNYGPLSFHPQQDKAIKETIPVSLIPLEQKLLAIGGQRMVYRREPDLASLLMRGEIFEGPVEIRLGTSRACHFNSAHLWNEARESFDLVTGYALSKDGFWRQHSWVIRKQPIIGQSHVIETTVYRERYFGFILTDHEAEKFFQMNT